MAENAWFYYFSSLAQTIAAGSALLVALAISRLQSLSNSLNESQRLLADGVYSIGQKGEYRKASSHFLNDDWTEYFNEVSTLRNACRHSFPSHGSYIESEEYVESLIAQGVRLKARLRALYRSLAVAFAGTLIFAGVAILILPLAYNGICPPLLFSGWTISALLLALLFGFYMVLVLQLRKRQ